MIKEMKNAEIKTSKQSAKKTKPDECTFKDVKVGDLILCFDEYSHDYIEHVLKVTSIEMDKEEGKVVYGDDQTYSPEETDDYITRVNEATFVGFVKNSKKTKKHRLLRCLELVFGVILILLLVVSYGMAHCVAF